MSGWLPPGVTDKDIDDAANGDGEMLQCDSCGGIYPRQQMLFRPYDHPNTNCHIDAAVCPKCRGEDEPDDND